MMDHLTDEHLSVRQVAAHVGVTERALQLAFRTHLGVTPAEMIRTRRVERIHGELQAHGGEAGVLEIASRWGVKNRSTLVHNYRSRFDDTFDCWALFEGTAWTPAGLPQRIRRNDPVILP